MLISSRASRISDVLTLKDVNEIADSPPGAVQDVVDKKIQQEIKDIADSRPAPIAHLDNTVMRYATVRSGKAEFEKSL
jgi:hypothetical protein